MEDYYDILGVGPKASEEEIKKAYRKISWQCHPDRNPGDKDAEERFKQVGKAMAVLGDPDQREQYDDLRRAYGKTKPEETDLRRFLAEGNTLADDQDALWDYLEKFPKVGVAGNLRRFLVYLNDLYNYVEDPLYRHMPGAVGGELLAYDLETLWRWPYEVLRANRSFVPLLRFDEIELKHAPHPDIGDLFRIWLLHRGTKPPENILGRFLNGACCAQKKPEKRDKLANDVKWIVWTWPDLTLKMTPEQLYALRERYGSDAVLNKMIAHVQEVRRNRARKAVLKLNDPYRTDWLAIFRKKVNQGLQLFR